MAVIQSRSREYIRQAVGYNLGAVYVSSASANGDTTSLIDNTLFGGNDTFNGKWIDFTSGNNDGAVRRVTDYVESGTDATLSPALSNSTASGDTYELWDSEWSPTIINSLINQAIDYATGRAYVPDEDLSLHLHPADYRYAIPSNIVSIRRLEKRKTYSSAIVHQCDAVWDESTDSNVTASIDSEDYRQGGASLKLVITSSVSNGDVLVTDSISSLNISKYDYVEFWVKCITALASDDLRLLLDNTANAVSPLELLTIPAISADTWSYVRVAMAVPESDTAIISVGLEYNANAGANTIWIDDVKAVRDISSRWESIDNTTWRIDKESREIIFWHQPEYKLLQIVGYDKPAQLNADGTDCEIDPFFVIAKATALALASNSGGSQTDPDDRRRLANWWESQALLRERRFPMLQGVRVVD
jgi:hypothetical protein